MPGDFISRINARPGVSRRLQVRPGRAVPVPLLIFPQLEKAMILFKLLIVDVYEGQRRKHPRAGAKTFISKRLFRSLEVTPRTKVTASAKSIGVFVAQKADRRALQLEHDFT